MVWLTPLLALALTVVFGAVLFALLGRNPIHALYVFLIAPLESLRGWAEVGVKMTPLLLCAVGLVVCFRASIWNIGAEGQFLAGAIAGGWAALNCPEGVGHWYLIVVLLAPFVEEVLFRGLVFGCLKEKSRIFAYILSCALFAFLHVWTAAVSNWDLGYLILMLQYLVPGLVFAWAYEHSGTLWTSILLHMLVNALSLFTIAS